MHGNELYDCERRLSSFLFSTTEKKPLTGQQWLGAYMLHSSKLLWKHFACWKVKFQCVAASLSPKTQCQHEHYFLNVTNFSPYEINYSNKLCTLAFLFLSTSTASKTAHYLICCTLRYSVLSTRCGLTYPNNEAPLKHVCSGQSWVRSRLHVALRSSSCLIKKSLCDLPLRRGRFRLSWDAVTKWSFWLLSSSCSSWWGRLSLNVPIISGYHLEGRAATRSRLTAWTGARHSRSWFKI